MTKAAIPTPIRFPCLDDPRWSCKLNLTSGQNLSDPMTVADLPLHHAAPEVRSVMGSRDVREAADDTAWAIPVTAAAYF